MKRKILFTIMALMTVLFLPSCEDNEPNATRAGIIAEDFVREKVISSSDLEYDVVGVDETDYQTYHVVANIKTMNGFGNMVPRKVSVRLKYLAGDWTDKESWMCTKVLFLDESTGNVE